MIKLKKLFFSLSISFGILFLVNIAWLIYNIVHWSLDGIEAIVHGISLFDDLYYSIYIKWILLADIAWWIVAFGFMIKRKHFKTDPKMHFLHYEPITEPNICVVIAAYNEEKSIKNVVTDFRKQKFVENIIVVDNNSSDKTVELAEKSGATVIKKEKNLGFGHSYAIGLKESLKTNANVIATVDADGTSNAYDIEKLLTYLSNTDAVIGTRQIQVLTEKGNQNSILHVWGNYILAKIIQFKYFSLLHMGIVSLTDVGCLYRLMRRDALENIVDELLDKKTGEAIGGVAFPLYLTMKSIEEDQRFVEVPVTFKKRVGESKTGTNKKSIGLKYGLTYLWFILKY